MTYVVVDASIWVARLVPQDEFHDLCKAWLEEKRSNAVVLVAPSLLLVELAGAVSRRTGSSELAERALQSLKHMPGLRLVEMNQTVVDDAASLAAILGMRGADALYAAVAHHLNIPLATLDNDQRDRASKVIQIEMLS